MDNITSRYWFGVTIVLLLVMGGCANLKNRRWFEVAALGQADVLQELVENGQSIHATNDQQQTALHLAAQSGNRDALAFLLSQGAAPGKTDAQGFTPLVYAARTGEEACVELLLSDAYLPRVEQLTLALFLACDRQSNVKVAEALLKAGADVNGVVFGRTALMKAASVGDLEMVQLLTRYKADPAIESESGKTAVIYAAEGMHLGTEVFLVEKILSGLGAESVFVPKMRAMLSGIYQDEALSREQKRLRIGAVLAPHHAQQNDESIAWLRLSAEDGFATAQYWLGLFLWKGNGIDSDPPEAIAWLREAALGGHDQADHTINQCYIDAESSPDIAKTEWLTALAIRGDPKAQYHLGRRLYSEGHEQQARQWLTRASAQGYEDAAAIQKRIDSLGDRQKHKRED